MENIVSQLSYHIQKDIEEFYEENSKKYEPGTLTIEEVLNVYLNWNGILGYTDDIMEFVRLAKKEASNV